MLWNRTRLHSATDLAAIATSRGYANQGTNLAIFTDTQPPATCWFCQHDAPCNWCAAIGTSFGYASNMIGYYKVTPLRPIQASCIRFRSPCTMKQAAQCDKRAAMGTSFGYANKGPSNATLFLADGDASSCSDKVPVGTAAMTCANNTSSGKQLRFRVTLLNTHT